MGVCFLPLFYLRPFRPWKWALNLRDPFFGGNPVCIISLHLRWHFYIKKLLEWKLRYFISLLVLRHKLTGGFPVWVGLFEAQIIITRNIHLIPSLNIVGIGLSLTSDWYRYGHCSETAITITVGLISIIQFMNHYANIHPWAGKHLDKTLFISQKQEYYIVQWLCNICQINIDIDFIIIL